MIANRIVLLTDQFTAGVAQQAIERCIDLVHPQSPVVICNSEASARYELHHGSDRLDTPLILVVGARGELACQSVFRIHVKMRARNPDSEPWHGGLIVVPLDPSAGQELNKEDLYPQLSGHAVVRVPVKLVDMFISCRVVGRLDPRYWQIVVEQSGLRAFWDFVRTAEAGLANGDLQICSENLRLALAQVIEEGALRYLVPHAEVLRKIEAANQRLLSIGISDAMALAGIAHEVTFIMSDYAIGK